MSKSFRVELIASSFLDLISNQARLNPDVRAFLLQHETSTKLKKLVNGKRISIRNVPTGKTGLPFQNFRLSREFSSGTNQEIVYQSLSNGRGSWVVGVGVGKLTMLLSFVIY